MVPPTSRHLNSTMAVCCGSLASDTRMRADDEPTMRPDSSEWELCEKSVCCDTRDHEVGTGALFTESNLACDEPDTWRQIGIVPMIAPLCLARGLALLAGAGGRARCRRPEGGGRKGRAGVSG